MLDIDDDAPRFELPTDQGSPARLAAFGGAPVVVYFYPKDDTSGCTKQAQAFTAQAAAFAAIAVPVIGISPDPVAAHAKFRNKYGLEVVLASDPDHAVASAYGVWVEKSMYGKTYMGIERSTFLVGADGRIVRIWRKVKVPGHAEEVLAAARELVERG